MSVAFARDGHRSPPSGLRRHHPAVGFVSGRPLGRAHAQRKRRHLECRLQPGRAHACFLRLRRHGAAVGRPDATAARRAAARPHRQVVSRRLRRRRAYARLRGLRRHGSALELRPTPDCSVTPLRGGMRPGQRASRSLPTATRSSAGRRTAASSGGECGAHRALGQPVDWGRLASSSASPRARTGARSRRAATTDRSRWSMSRRRVVRCPSCTVMRAGSEAVVFSRDGRDARLRRRRRHGAVWDGNEPARHSANPCAATRARSGASRSARTAALLASAGADGTLRLWDCEDRPGAGELPLPGRRRQ